MTACDVISVAGTVLMPAAPETIVSMFLQEGEQELLTMSAYALRIYGLTYLTRWFSLAVQSFTIPYKEKSLRCNAGIFFCYSY